ncbi:MAG: tetratricopeptide repeat protein [Verrucomicrobiota bacterium]
MTRVCNIFSVVTGISFSSLSFATGTTTEDLLDQVNPEAERIEASRELQNGVRAVETGFPALGFEYLNPLVRSELLSQEEKEKAFLYSLTALIQLDHPADALELARGNPQFDSGPRRLRWAMAEFLLGNTAQARNRLESVPEGSLSGDDEAWFFFFQGLLADHENDPARASDLFNEAQESATSPFLRDTFDTIRARLNILRGEVDEDTVISLKNQFEEAVALPLRLRLAREYALVLMGLGQSEEAIQFLEEFVLQTEADDSRIADEILLPLAVFRGLSTTEGQATLWEILRSGTDRDTLRITLNLLLRQIKEPKPSQAEILETIVDTRPDHPIRDRLIFARSQLLSDTGDASTAINLLDSLLKEYPGTPIKLSAQLAYAFLAWQQDPPQLRTAAVRLLEILPELPPPDRPFYYQLAGDLYYENGDYAFAAAAYRDAWDLSPSEGVAFQYTLALLQSGEIEAALEWINQNVKVGEQISPEVNRRIFWNVASTLIQNGEPQLALENIDTILTNGEIPTGARQNFDWLRAYTLSLLGENDEALATTEAILAEFSYESPFSEDLVEEEPEAAEEVEPADEPEDPLLAQTLLLKGEILFKSGNPEDAAEIMADLRDRFPDRRAAVLSYLFEARYFAGRDLTGEAQQRLVNLADRFPESDYAPLALYEAAIIAESRGTPESISEAIRFLETLVNRFPQHQLAIHARLKEGEILRSLGDFSSARLVFQNTANLFSNHPLQYLAEIGTAETVLANPEASPEELLNAAAILAKVETVPDLPPAVLLESQLKRAETLRRANEPLRARRLLWETVNPLIDQPTTEDSALAFWLSKSLLELSIWFAQDGFPEEAKQFLEIVDKRNLPGSVLARAKLRATELQTTETE